MISSVEEFILLLKKWSAESTRVQLLASFVDTRVPSCRAVLCLSGAVTGIDEHTQVFQIGNADQFATIGFTGCRLGYGTGDDVELSSPMADADQLEDLVCLVAPSSLSICLYTVRPAPEQ